jgi:hypothetical protein
MPNYDDDDDWPLVDELRFLNARLRRYSLIILLGVLFNILTNVVVATIVSVNRGYIDLRALVVVPTLTTIVALLCIAMYDSMRRRAAALFEELSDEYQWWVRGSASRLSESGLRSSRPPIVIRVALRESAQAQNVPFFPGNFGPGIYAIVNICLLLAMLFIIL